MRLPSKQVSRLARFFQDALLLLGMTELLLGCAGPVVAPTSASLGHESGFQPMTCVEAPWFEPEAGAPALLTPVLLPEIAPAIAVDYVELHADRSEETRGTACHTASRPGRCLADLNGLFDVLLGWELTDDPPQEDPIRCWLRVTRGDDAMLINGLQSLLRFLGPIDTLAEAELLSLCARVDFRPPWVWRQTQYLECGRSGGVVRPDGYDVLAFTGEGCDGRTRHLLHVGATGAITSLESVNEAADRISCRARAALP